MELVMHSPTDSDDTDISETQPRKRTESLRERHALKILGAIMLIMLATVIFVQVAC
jgi:hypothetical protein